MKACCGFGHREVFENISKQLDAAVLMAIKDGCKIFYTGAKGDFDSLISSAVRKAKKIYSHIKLICVKPYMINDVNTNRDYYATMYDDVIIPDELAPYPLQSSHQSSQSLDCGSQRSCCRIYCPRSRRGI